MPELRSGGQAGRPVPRRISTLRVWNENIEAASQNLGSGIGDQIDARVRSRIAYVNFGPQWQYAGVGRYDAGLGAGT
jgi:hypothetical protein